MPDLAAPLSFSLSRERAAAKDADLEAAGKHYFPRLIGRDKIVLDLACGYGEFINNVDAAKKYAVDLNPDAPQYLDADVEFHALPANAMRDTSADDDDVVFTFNFLEHSRRRRNATPCWGRFSASSSQACALSSWAPNIRYLAAEYWDFYDHYLPLSHLSLKEGLIQAGYDVVTIIPRFLPYTTRSALPTHPFLIALYLKLPIFWPLLGKQFLLVGRKRGAARAGADV